MVRLLAIGTVLAVQVRDQQAAVELRQAQDQLYSQQHAPHQNLGPSPPSSQPSSSCFTAAPLNSYGSTMGAALNVALLLRVHHGVYVRPLGDTVYLMVTPTAPRVTCDRLLGALQQALEAHCKGQQGSLRAGQGQGVGRAGEPTEHGSLI